MKVGIITINSQNMGNRLQNYAVQQVLRKMGYEVETINNAYCGREVTTLRHTLKICVTGRALPQLFQRRREGFYQFNKRFIKMSDITWNPDRAPQGIDKEYDYFVCGSDQIWNPYFDFVTGNEFLEFARPEQKIAYAASIGVEEIPEKNKEQFKKRISDFKCISVREKAGADIIREISGKEVPVLTDPTLMLDRDEWLNIAEKPTEIPTSRYLLTYFLGEKTRDTIEFITETAKAHNWEIVNLWDIKEKKYFLANPSEFLYYVAHCEMMCTDSFHGTVFSIIMGVPFCVRNRVDNVKSMNSRLETLIGMLKLEHVSKTNDIEYANSNYGRILKIIQTERMKTESFLNSAFGRV